MTKRVADLTGTDLDRAVANAHGMMLYTPDWQPSRNWSQAGPLIEEGRINITTHFRMGAWEACYLLGNSVVCQKGRTALEAAMRCYVMSRLGEEIDDESI
jgi:hypothetical protein